MKARLASMIALALLAGCSRQGRLEDGGVFVVRSACPQVAIAEGAGEISLADPAGNVRATISDIGSDCSEDASTVASTARFEISATRQDAGPARQVVLTYFAVAVQGGNQVAAKRLGRVALNFPAGSQRAETATTSTVRVNRSVATLPEDVRRELTRRRRPGDADAAIDPMTDPKIRDAVARATFEHLVGFQISPEQLRANLARR